MAAYTTDSALDARIGEDLITDLLDLDEDAGDDSATLTAAIADVGSIIDAYCAKRYTVPFAAITDTPATPALIQTIAKKLVYAELLKPRRELNVQREMYEEDAIKLLELIRDGEIDVPGGSLLSADEAGVGLAYDDTEPTFAGHDDDLEDRMRNY